MRLAAAERLELQDVLQKLKRSSEKVRRAQILLKADADGPRWTETRIADAFSCRLQTVEKLRRMLVECGFREALDGASREEPPIPKMLDSEQEARTSRANARFFVDMSEVTANRLNPRETVSSPR